MSERKVRIAPAPTRLQRLPSPSIRRLPTEPQADSTTPVPTGKPAARDVVVPPAPVVLETRRTCASVSRTDCRNPARSLVRRRRRPPMTYPTLPRRIAVNFARTQQRSPGRGPSPNNAFAALQREPTTGRMSRTHVTRFHGLNSLGAKFHRPRAPSRRTPRAGGAGDPGAWRRR